MFHKKTKCNIAVRLALSTVLWLEILQPAFEFIHKTEHTCKIEREVVNCFIFQ